MRKRGDRHGNEYHLHICNQQVVGSIPIASSIANLAPLDVVSDGVFWHKALWMEKFVNLIRMVVKRFTLCYHRNRKGAADRRLSLNI